MAQDSISLYKDFKVGYVGDYAGVNLTLTKPTIGTSSCQESKYKRVNFSVETTSHTFGRAALCEEIASRQKVNGDDPTLPILRVAQGELNRFIKEQGNTNPHEAVDWETTQPA